MPKILCTLFVCLLAGTADARQATVSVLATTDLHGTIYPFDYYTEKATDRGLAKLATLIRAERQRNPNSLLIDCGDTIQGSPLEFVHQRSATGPDPMMLAMNSLGYSAMVLGNHEFNYGLRTLQRARSDARFPWLSANTEGEPAFRPYIVQTVDGVKIAVVGITTPAIPTWEKPENYRGYRFLDGVETARKTVAALREKERPDVVVLAVHAGRGDGGENMVDALAASVTGIDAIVFGHTHRELKGELAGGVLLVQPRNAGGQLARIDFTLDGQPGAWRLSNKSATLIAPTRATEADPEILSLARPYHEMAERYLGTPVAEAPVTLEGRFGRIEDNPLLDAVHEVQMHYAKADVSFASLFSESVKVPQGRVTVRQIAALYYYDNDLYAIEGTGKMVKDALENSARYFDGGLPGYNYDTAEGVEYEIDIARAAGDRIRNLRYKGQPLRPEQQLRIAVNNYRAAGSGGYAMFRDARIVWRSSENIRDLIVAYYTERGRLRPSADRNWRIVPPSAVERLRAQTPQQ